MDRILLPHGFVRQGNAWNRRSALWVDAVDVQASTARDAFAVNIGVADPDVYERCRGRPLPEVVVAADGTVTTRLGILMTGRDRWFDEADFGAGNEVVSGMTGVGLPFADRMHSSEAMEDFLTQRLDGLLPYEVLSLALVRAKLGRRRDACAVLTEKRPRVASPWVDRFTELKAELGCPH